MEDRQIKAECSKDGKEWKKYITLFRKGEHTLEEAAERILSENERFMFRNFEINNE
jgi:hypothetical protein